MREYFDDISIGGLLFGDGWLRWEEVFGYYQNKSKFEGEGEEMQALRMWRFFFLEKGKIRLRKTQWSSRLERACGCRIASKVFISERCSGRTNASV